MRLYLIVLVLALLGISVIQDGTFQVSRVIDGDTIEIEWQGRKERVRYIGIDTPELKDDREIVRELAEAARQANADMVGGRLVRLEFDVAERDRYGRLLAYVWVDRTMVNERLVRNGFASVATYPPNVKYVDRFIAAEEAWRDSTGH